MFHKIQYNNKKTNIVTFCLFLRIYGSFLIFSFSSPHIQIFMSSEPQQKKLKTMTSVTSSETKSNSWVEYDAATCDFPIQNLPYGIFKPSPDAPARCGTAIGKYVLDLSVLHETGMFQQLGTWTSVFCEPTLNSFMGLGSAKWAAARAAITRLLDPEEGALRDNEAVKGQALIEMSAVIMCLPCRIGDYTDFYASREHATNVGTMFRGADNALQPNWLTLPVGYHGRASSVVVTGTPIRRPRGQLQKDRADPKQGSTHGPCKLLDFELEMGCFVGPGNKLGDPIDMNKVEDHIFGFVILNDWSARDIQKWEYIPLGPFTAKNVMSTISPWIVTPAALNAFACPTSAGTQTDPVPHKYLQDPNYGSYDLNLSVAIKPVEKPDAAPSVITNSNFKYMYWNHRQQLVHHTVTGCNMQPGDLLGSGTISGPTADPPTYGSMLELAWAGPGHGPGSKAIDLGNGVERKFLKDGDEVFMTGFCQGNGYRVGFGECRGVVLPAHTN